MGDDPGGQPPDQTALLGQRHELARIQEADDFRDTVESGALRWADTLEELAEAVGVDPTGPADTAAATVRLAGGCGTDDLAAPRGRPR